MDIIFIVYNIARFVYNSFTSSYLGTGQIQQLIHIILGLTC